MILDMLGIGRMYPRLLELRGRFRFSTDHDLQYGVLLAAAYLLGLKLAMSRAQARGLDAAKVLDLGIYIIISALIRGQAPAVVTDFGCFGPTRRSSSRLHARAAFLRRLLLAVAVALW